MTRLACLAFSIAALAMPAVAQAQAPAQAPAQAQAQAQAQAKQAAAALPSADALLARYEAFLGGARALQAVSTRTTITRRIEFSDHPSDAVLTRQSRRPMLSIMRHEALDGSFIRYMNGCDEQGNWVGYGRPGDPPAPKPGKASTDGVCEEEQYYYEYLPLDLARLKANIKSFEVRAEVDIVPMEPGSFGRLAGGQGPDLVPGGPRRAYLVLGLPVRTTDTAVWLYFDRQTGALLRRASAGPADHPALPGQNDRYTDFLQYRAVGDGTRAPFQFVTVAPNSEVRGISTAVVDNAAFAPDTFVRPRDVSRKDRGL